MTIKGAYNVTYYLGIRLLPSIIILAFIVPIGYCILVNIYIFTYLCEYVSNFINKII